MSGSFIVENMGRRTTESLANSEFFNEKPYFIGSILKETQFGHHGSYAFPFFQLAEKYKMDFALSGGSSNGLGWVFIELQSPKSKVLLDNGQPGAQAREGLYQIAQWKDWLRNNANYAKEKSGLNMKGLHDGLIKYCLVIGRRPFKDKENEWRNREQADDKSLIIMSYDRIGELFLSEMNHHKSIK